MLKSQSHLLYPLNDAEHGAL